VTAAGGGRPMWRREELSESNKIEITRQINNNNNNNNKLYWIWQPRRLDYNRHQNIHNKQ